MWADQDNLGLNNFAGGLRRMQTVAIDLDFVHIRHDLLKSDVL